MGILSNMCGYRSRMTLALADILHLYILQQFGKRILVGSEVWRKSDFQAWAFKTVYCASWFSS